MTVTNTTKQGQLNVTWVPPNLKYMDDSMMYEVSYSVVGSHGMQVMLISSFYIILSTVLSESKEADFLIG